MFFSVQEVRKNHKKWLAENRHMKYLWIPYTDSVVVVKNNPVPEVRYVCAEESEMQCFFISGFKVLRMDQPLAGDATSLTQT